MPDVILRRGALGDVVLVGSVTASLTAAATVVTDARWVGLVRRFRGVRRVLPWGSALPPGRVVDLQRSLRTLRIPAASRVRKHSVRRRLRMRTRFVSPRPTVPELYAAALGVRPVGAPWIDLPRRPRDGLALIPGAAWAPKRWAADRMAAVGQAWEGPVFVLGGPGEAEVVHAVADAVGGALPVVERGFDDTLDALARCRVAVAGDTGLMHLAGATGARVVALFGPTHPDDGFFVYPGTVVSRPRWCRPCTLHRRAACPLGHGQCMDLTVADVVAAVRACVG